MFLSPEMEIKVINAFRKGDWTDKSHKMEYFFIFLILKRMGISVKDAVGITDFQKGSTKRNIASETLFITAALFDPIEKPGKACCLDPFGFNATMEDYKYFNRGTEWNSLLGRIPDTIDNTIRDYYLTRETNANGLRFFTLRQNYVDILLGSNFLDGKRINAYLLASWIYRFYEFADLKDSSSFMCLTVKHVAKII
jgi:hypothetical protein